VTLDKSLIDSLPHPDQVRDLLGDALRNVELLRRLLRISERAEQYRRGDRQRRPTGQEVLNGR
jgi:hypothetical protein